MRLAPLLILLVARPCFADALTDLRAKLTALGAKEPVRAKVSFSLWRETKEEKKALEGQVALQTDEGPEGLRITYSPAQLGRLRDEARALAADGDTPIPLQTATQELSVSVVGELLGQAEVLLRSLANAKLVAESDAIFEGTPARLLELEVTPSLPPGIRKRVKKVQDRLNLWLGKDGLPIATEERVVYSGSAMLVSFEGSVSQRQKLVRAGDRLVVAQRSAEDEFSGFGAGVHSRKSITLTLP